MGKDKKERKKKRHTPIPKKPDYYYNIFAKKGRKRTRHEGDVKIAWTRTETK